MKLTTLTTIISLTTSLAAAQPHRPSRHLHLHHGTAHSQQSRDLYTGDQDDQRHEKRVTEVVDKTVYVYELNGRPISQEEVNQGIRNGTLVFSSPGTVEEASVPTSVTSTTMTARTVSPARASGRRHPPHRHTAQEQTIHQHRPHRPHKPGHGQTIDRVITPQTPDEGERQRRPPAEPQPKGHQSGSLTSTGVDKDFPDGQLDCSQFPSEYGPIDVSWLGLGGWTGIQAGSSSGNALYNIETVVASSCSGGNCCKEGAYCSYACPPGYQKSQWPTTQGGNGESVGGIQCQNGKLHLTNPSLSTKLCMPGSSQVKVQVQNNMSQNSAICRTDYPGTEGETVPMNSEPGSTEPLTCPDAANYYEWQGGKTSAQYYVNPAGVSVSDACQWGSSANPTGNWAPLNLGVGYNGGAAWLSIFQNYPTTTSKLNFKVELVGDTMVGKCKYENGQYCTGDNYEDCDDKGTKCTVSVPSGTVTFVFSDA